MAGPVQHGWWANEETACDKFRRWAGAVGKMPEPRVTLVDEETDTLATWPTEP
ncbi:hypothetical protein [Streptomyces sp. NPDC054834]